MNSLAEIVALLYDLEIYALYNKTIEGAVQSVMKLNDSILSLSERMDTVTALLREKVSYSDNNLYHGITHTYSEQNITQVREEPSARNEKAIPEPTHGYVELAKNIGQVAQGGVELAEVLGASENIGKIKNLIKGFNALADAAGGVEKFAAATETIGEVAAGAEILAGAEGVAAALATFGSVPGILAGAGVLAVGGIAAFTLRNNENAKKEESNFMAEGVKNKNPAILAVQNNAVDASKIAEAAMQMDDGERKKAKSKLVDSFIKNGGEIRFDENRAAKDPVYVSAVVEALDKSTQMKSHPIKGITFSDVKEMNSFATSYDNLDMYKKSVLPKRPVTRTKSFGIVSRQVLEFLTEKEYNARFHPQPMGDKMIPIIKQQILTDMLKGYLNHDKDYVQGYLKKMEAKYKDSRWFPAAETEIKAWCAKGVDNIERSKETNRTGTQRSSHANGNDSFSPGSRSITINLNKAMIEHFTVNAKEIKEGMNEFKHKVEEVLLEILNSVNTH